MSSVNPRRASRTVWRTQKPRRALSTLRQAQKPRRADVTPLRPHRPNRAIRTTLSVPGGIFILFLVTLVTATGLVARALWTDNHTTNATAIEGGDFSIELGDLTWNDGEIIGGVSDLSTVIVSPGQPLTLRQELRATLVGNNLAMALSIAFSSLPSGAAGSWHVEMDGTQVAPEPDGANSDVPLSDTLVILGVEQHHSMDIVITLTDLVREPQWVNPVTSTTGTPISLGTLSVTADQIRCGPGFIVSCSSQTEGGDQ